MAGKPCTGEKPGEGQHLDPSQPRRETSGFSPHSRMGRPLHVTPKVFFRRHMMTVLVKPWLSDCRDDWKLGQSEPSPSTLPLCSSPQSKVLPGGKGGSDLGRPCLCSLTKEAWQVQLPREGLGNRQPLCSAETTVSGWEFGPAPWFSFLERLKPGGQSVRAVLDHLGSKPSTITYQLCDLGQCT